MASISKQSQSLLTAIVILLLNIKEMSHATQMYGLQFNRNLPLSLGGVKNVMKGYCPPTSMGLPITLSPPYF